MSADGLFYLSTPAGVATGYAPARSSPRAGAYLYARRMSETLGEYAAKTPAQARLEAAGKRYWSHGEGAAKIGWGTHPHDFDTCVSLVIEAGVPAHEAKGYCAERHHEALGVWPGQEHG